MKVDRAIEVLGETTEPAGAPANDSGKLPRVWILRCHREGDNAQSLSLASALGWPFEVKRLGFHWYEIFAALAAWPTRLGIDGRRSSPLAPPWPDLIILAGRRNEIPARWIKRKSGGRTRIVVVGRYWTPPDFIDLVITTPQFRLPRHLNVLHNDFPLHTGTPERTAEAGALWLPRLAALPKPRIAVLVGGSSGPYIFSAATARRLGEEASAMARAAGGSLLVSTSARTRAAAIDALEAAIDVPYRLYRWRANDAENPYLGFLAAADAFIVTGDSMSMLAEACNHGRPVRIFEFGNGPAAMHGPRSTQPELRQWWRWSQLSDQGIFGLPYGLAIGLPAWRLNRSRDIRLMQDRFVASGRARWMGNGDIGSVRAASFDDLGRAVNRVRALFDRSNTNEPLALSLGEATIERV